MEDIFIRWWDKILQRYDDDRLFLEVNFKLFQTAVDCLNKRKIAPPNSSLEIPCVEKENGIFIQQIFLAFGS